MSMERPLGLVTAEQLRSADDFAVIDTDDPGQYELFCFRAASLTVPGAPAPTLPRLFEITMRFSEPSQWSELTALLRDAGRLHSGSQAVIDGAIAKYASQAV